MATAKAFVADDRSTYSSLVEAVMEHMFCAAIMKRLWLDGIRAIEVLHSTVDDNGYDIVFEVQSVVRHIQLKGVTLGGSTVEWKVHRNLTLKPAGCLVVVAYDPATLDLAEFYWLGNAPGEPFTIPETAKEAVATRRNKEGVRPARPNIRIIRKSQMTRLAGSDALEQLVRKLFGTQLQVEGVAGEIDGDPLEAFDEP